MPLEFESVLREYMSRRSAAVAARPRLNLGSGRDRRAGYVNLDAVALPDVDVVAWLGAAPLPFQHETFGAVLCRDVLEHVDVVPALREIHRVTAPGGLVVISAVHFSSRNLYVDPTHVRGYSVRTLDFFGPARERPWARGYYFDFSFTAVEHAAIQFNTTLGHGRFFFWDRAVEPAVNARPWAQDLYETTFLSRIFPAANVLVVLRR